MKEAERGKVKKGGLGSSLVVALRELDFAIDVTRPIPYGLQIRLKCGGVINAYDSGAVVVGGRIHAAVYDESITLLRKALPPGTKWCCGERAERAVDM